jgi:uncharacterized membrane protein YgcG
MEGDGMTSKKKPPMTIIAVGAGALAVGAIVLAQPGKDNSARVTAASRNAAAPAVRPISLDAPERKPLSYYTGTVRNNLFSGGPAAPEPPKPKVAAAKPKPEPLVKPTVPTAVPVSAPEPVNPFAEYSYTGTVNMNGRMVALIENTRSKDGQYLKEGDSFMGGTVASVSERSVTIDVAGKQEMLAKTDTFKLTPFDKSAPFLTQQPAAGAPGAPGQAGGAPGQARAGAMPGGTPAWMNNMPADRRQQIMDRINSMTPEQREQMQQRFMNRSFEGGGRGNRGNRGGGENGGWNGGNGGNGGGRRNRGGGGF